LKYTLLYIAEKPVNRGIAAFFGVEEGGEHPEKGVQEGVQGVFGRDGMETTGLLHSSSVQNPALPGLIMAKPGGRGY